MRNHGQDLLPMEEAGAYCFYPAALHVAGTKGIQQAMSAEIRMVFPECYSNHHIPYTRPLGPHLPQAQDHQLSLSNNMLEMESHLDYGQPHVFMG